MSEVIHGHDFLLCLACFAGWRSLGGAEGNSPSAAHILLCSVTPREHWCDPHQTVSSCSSFYFSFKFILFYLFIFRQTARKGEREGEKHQCVGASWVPPTGDLALNLGMCPDWESNRWPFCLQGGTQSTEPHLPGPASFCFSFLFYTLHRRFRIRQQYKLSVC